MMCRTILDDGTSQRLATLAGMGISINSLWSVAQDIETGRLVRLLPDWRSHDWSVLWLIYPKSNVLTPKVGCFMDFPIGRLEVDRATKSVSPESMFWQMKQRLLDLSRFDAAPLRAFTATKGTDYGTETDGRIPPRSCAHCIDQWADAQTVCR